MSTQDDVAFENLNVENSYSNLLNTPDNHIYYVDISYANSDSGYDLSGYVFEFFTLDASNELQINPQFDTMIQQDRGLSDCSAVATLDISLSNFQNLFSFQSDSSDLDDLSENDIKYGITSIKTCFDNINFSNATVQYGQINSFYDDQNVSSDYIRNLAKQITGGLSASDIFSNEENLITGIENIDISLDTSLNEKLEDAYTNQSEYLTLDNFDLSDYSDLYKAARALFVINLNSNTSSTNYSRTIDLFNDISSVAQETQTDGSNCDVITVPLNFHNGDIIAVRVEYHQEDTTGGLDSNFSINITPRSYKMLLRLVED